MVSRIHAYYIHNKRSQLIVCIVKKKIIIIYRKKKNTVGVLLMKGNNGTWAMGQPKSYPGFGKSSVTLYKQTPGLVKNLTTYHSSTW